MTSLIPKIKHFVVKTTLITYGFAAVVPAVAQAGNPFAAFGFGHRNNQPTAQQQVSSGDPEPPPPAYYPKTREYAAPVDRDERPVAHGYGNGYGQAQQEICQTGIRFNMYGATPVYGPCNDIPLLGPGGLIPIFGGFSIGTQSNRRGVETTYDRGSDYYNDGKVYHSRHVNDMGIPKKSGSKHFNYNR